MNDALERARERVNQAFAGFVGNEEAVYSIKRPLIVALASTKDGALPCMPKTFLLSGPPSVGKTELARRIASCLGVPFVRLDGRAVKSRDKLFDMIDEALLSHRAGPKRDGDRAGVPQLIYPPFGVFIDEVHLVSDKTQEGLLTLLEADDRSLLLDSSDRGRRVAVVGQAAWIFATTRPAVLDSAFRSRCAEIPLRRYTVEEVTVMVRVRYPNLPDEQATDVATCSRLTPRVAFAMADEVNDELVISPGSDVKSCVRRVMHGRGILFANGVGVDDLRYLEVLQRERRPVGESVIQAALHDVAPTKIEEDVEPFLLMKNYIAVTPKGRTITLYGEEFLNRARQIELPM